MVNVLYIYKLQVESRTLIITGRKTCHLRTTATDNRTKDARESNPFLLVSANEPVLQSEL